MGAELGEEIEGTETSRQIGGEGAGQREGLDGLTPKRRERFSGACLGPGGRWGHGTSDCSTWMFLERRSPAEVSPDAVSTVTSCKPSCIGPTEVMPVDW